MGKLQFLISDQPTQTDATESIKKDPPGKKPRFLTEQAPGPTGFVSSSALELPSIEGVNPQDLNALLGTIRQFESSNDPSAYNVLYGGSQFADTTAHPNARKEFYDKSGNKNYTTAAGAYQINKPTFDDFAARTGITGFSPAEQDQLAIAILESEGAIDALKNGDYEGALAAAGKRWVGVGGRLAADSNQHSAKFSKALEAFAEFRSGEKGLEPKDFDNWINAAVEQETLIANEMGLDPLKPYFGSSSYTRQGDVSKYADYMESISPFQDIDKVRAQNQTNWEQVGHSLGRMVPNAALGIVEGAGILLDFQAIANTVSGQGDDYSNWLTDLARQGQESMNEALPVYREAPSKVWNPGDFAWWIENGEGLVTSVASFFALGAGLAAVTSKVASGAAKLAGAMAKGTRAARGVAQVATAAGLAYSEGAMEAANVYEQVYNEATDHGLSQSDAKRQAAQSAAHTVRINTMINTALNMTGSMAFFRSLRSQAALSKAGLKREVGETMGAYLTRLKENPTTRSFLTTLLAESGREAPQEALEEVVNEISSAEGLFRGQQLLGVTDERSLGERVADVVMTPQALLSATLGAVGGAGQALVTGLAPTRTLATGDGKTKPSLYKRYQTRASREHAAIEEAQTQTRNDIIKTIDSHNDAQKRMQEAADKGDINAYNQAKRDLFSLTAYDRIINGMDEQLLATFEEIRDLSPEEAEKRGWDIRPESDNYYKKMANDRIDQSKKLTTRWNQIQDTYSFDNDEHLSRLPYFIFGSEVEIESLNEGIKELEKNQEAIRGAQVLADSPLGSIIGYQEFSEVNAELQSIQIQREIIQKKRAAIQNLLNTEGGRLKLQKQYNTYDAESVLKAVQDSESALDARESLLNTKLDAADQSILNAFGGNEDLARKAFADWAGKNTAYIEALTSLSGTKTSLQSEKDELTSSLNNVLSKKGRRAHVKAFNTEIDRLKKLQEDKIVEEIKNVQDKKQLDNISKTIDPDNPRVSDELARKNAALNAEELKNERDALREIDKQVRPDSESIMDERPSEEQRDFRDEIERQEYLDFMFSFQDYKEGLDAYQFLVSKAFKIDKEFHTAVMAHFKSLRNVQKPSEKAGETATDSQDKATAPTDPTQNSFIGEDEMDEEIDSRIKETKQRTPAGKVVVQGRLIVPGAVALAHKSKDHAVKVSIDEKGNKTITKVDVGEGLNENLILETLSAKHLQPGDAIKIELDTNFVHPETGVTYDQLAAGPDGWMHAPMRIVYNGKTVGWLHDTDWIDASEGGEPTNVAKVDSDGNQNWAQQQKDIRAIRQKVFADKSVDTEIVFHGPGILNFSYQTDADGNRIKERRAISEQTDNKIKFFVSRNGRHETTLGDPFEGAQMGDPLASGQPGIMIPTSATDANGKVLHIPIPIWIPTSREVDSDWTNDLFDMIRIFHKPKTASETKDLSDASGTRFNKNADIAALHDILINYFLSSDFKKEDLRNTKTSSSRIFAHFSKDTGDVKLARHAGGRGGGVIYTTNESLGRQGGAFRYMFATNPDGSFTYEAELKRILGDMFLNLDVDRANGGTNIKHVRRGEGGNWTSSRVKYRQFMRDSFQTSVHGVPVDNGDWTYTVQPVITFRNPTGKKQVATPAVKKPTKPKKTKESKPAPPKAKEELEERWSVSTESKPSASLEDFLLSDDEMDTTPDGRVETSEESNEAKRSSPFFSFPSVVAVETISEQLQSNGDIRLTCKV